jgi:hypothetical protein
MKYLFIIIVLIAGCKKDRYILTYDVTVESDVYCSEILDNGPPRPCAPILYKYRLKKGEYLSLRFQGCGKNVRIKAYAGKKVFYDENKYSHNQIIEIK